MAERAIVNDRNGRELETDDQVRNSVREGRILRIFSIGLPSPEVVIRMPRGGVHVYRTEVVATDPPTYVCAELEVVE